MNKWFKIIVWSILLLIVDKYGFISNIGYVERINKLKANPKKWKAHLTKQYVKDFFDRYGIVQYELDHQLR